MVKVKTKLLCPSKKCRSQIQRAKFRAVKVKYSTGFKVKVKLTQGKNEGLEKVEKFYIVLMSEGKNLSP